ncbi:hypothetical protein ACTGJ9_036995 [Bradyrhizobium sp. RDM12]
MAKKIVSATDLAWIVLEELMKEGVRPQGLGIIPDRNSWSVVIETRGRKNLQKGDLKRIAAVEKRLRSIYGLAN